MNVYEVSTERSNENNEIITTRRFVTVYDESLVTVSKYFESECESLGDTLIGVRYVLTVCQQIKEA